MELDGISALITGGASGLGAATARALSAHGVRVTDGMLTGWHEPASSHLLMLEAIAGRDRLRDSYEAALREQYRWHEFGDVHLILP